MTYKEMEIKIRKIIEELAPEGTDFKWGVQKQKALGDCEIRFDKVKYKEYIVKKHLGIADLSDYRQSYKCTIHLNDKYMRYLPWEEVRLTLLHEIAHSLVPDHYHDEVWRAKCIEIGGDGEQYADDFKDGVGDNWSLFPYMAKCPECGKIYYSLTKGKIYCYCGFKDSFRYGHRNLLLYEYNKKSEALSETKRIFRKNIDYIRINPTQEEKLRQKLNIKDEDFVEWCRNEILKDDFEFTYKDGKCYAETENYRFSFDALSMMIKNVTKVDKEKKSRSEKQKTTTQPKKIPGDGVWINFDEMAFFLNDKKYILGQTTPINLVMDGIYMNDPSGCGAELRLKEGSVSRVFEVGLAGKWKVDFYAVNTTDSDQQVRDCPLCELMLTIEDKEMKYNHISFNFPVTMTDEALLETAGEPSTIHHAEEEKQGGTGDTYIYEHNDRSYSFKFIDHKLKEVEMIFRP